VFSRRGHASGAPKHRGEPGTPRSSKRVTDLEAPVAEKGQQKRKARLKQSQIDLSMFPAGASSPPHADFGRGHRPGVSSPIDLEKLSTQSGEDDIIPTTITRRRLKKPSKAISSDDSDVESLGLEIPPTKNVVDTDMRDPFGNAHARPDRQRKCRLSDHLRETTKSRSLHEDESDDEIVVSSPAKRRHRRITSMQRTINSPKDAEAASDDDIQPSPIRRRTRIRRLASATGDASMEQPTDPLTPLKSSSQQEQADIDEDLEDLRSSSKSPLPDCMSR